MMHPIIINSAGKTKKGLQYPRVIFLPDSAVGDILDEVRKILENQSK